MDSKRLPAFKAYDIRGRIPDELNEDMAYEIGRAYTDEINPKGTVAVGRDVRQSSPAISEALIEGLRDSGVDVADIGLCGTEMVYYASSLPGMGGGVMITASHNPKEFNGFKLVREEARPISEDTGLLDIEKRVRTKNIPSKSLTPGKLHKIDVMDGYIEKVLSFVDIKALKPFKIVVNAGNGCAGPVLEKLEKSLPFELVKVFFEPDGSFPNGIPNPLLTENRSATSNRIKEFGADFGVAWDGDFDRCFIFDENGGYIEGYYLVGFLAKQILKKHPGEKIVHDPRLIWNTIEMVEAAGGVPVISKSGHSFIKEKMRETKAVYGGEMSAHHYFRDFTYADSGMITWLLVAQEMSSTGAKLSSLVEERINLYPCSGEINRKVSDPDGVIEMLKKSYAQKAVSINELDGVSLEFGDDWRFNIRKSNTEPVVRLNVESKNDRNLMENKTAEILGMIDSL